MPSFRTLLILARASNLPTVWSNCLAAWWLGGRSSSGTLVALLVGASLLYTGGMCLNDAVDASFDRQHRRERPIPSGQISEATVWRISLALLILGALALILAGALPARPGITPPPAKLWSGRSLESPSGRALPPTEPRTAPPEAHFEHEVPHHAIGEFVEPEFVAPRTVEDSSSHRTERDAQGIRTPATTVVLTVALVGCIVLYDLVHKLVTFSPMMMGGCRLLLYLTAASVGDAGLTGLAVWSGLALACYVAGLSYFARIERMLRRPEWWPCLLLAAPIGLALLANNGSYLQDATLLAVILGLWLLRSLRPALWSSQQNITRTVGALIAGIVLVDLLATCGAPREFSFVFLLLFTVALVFQRFVPAT